MAKVKNLGSQTRGFYTEEGGHVTVKPGEEKDFNMTEADFNRIKELAASEDPPTFEIGGSPGGVTAKDQEAAAKKREAEAAKKREHDEKEAAKKKA